MPAGVTELIPLAELERRGAVRLKKKKKIRAESEAAGPREGHLAEPGLLSISVSLRLSLSQQELQAFFNLKQRNVRWMDVWEDWGNFGNTSRTYESCNPRRDCLRAGLRLDEAGEGPAQAVPGELGRPRLPHPSHWPAFGLSVACPGQGMLEMAGSPFWDSVSQPCPGLEVNSGLHSCGQARPS